MVIYTLPVWLSGLEGIGELKDHLTEPRLKVVGPKSLKLNFWVSDKREKDPWNSGIELET